MTNTKPTFTYYAKIDGKEVQLRKSTHEYHFASLTAGMYAKTRQALESRIHTETFHLVNYYKKIGFYSTYDASTQITTKHSLNSEEFKKRIQFAEQLEKKYIDSIVEVYTK